MMDSKVLLVCWMVVVLATGTPIGDLKTQGCPPERCFSRDCGEVLENDPSAVSGDYIIQPVDGGPQFVVYCEIREDGAWTVIQRREDGLVNFNRGWEDYKQGFGNVHSEFWLGNEQINRITSSGDYELLVEITDHLNAMKFSKYSHFRIGTEWSNYMIKISGYTGTAGNSLNYHNNMPFTTKDRDNDAAGSRNCAESTEGGWWYNNCYHSSLNGLYLTPGNVPTASKDKGVIWHHYKGSSYSHKLSEMMVKRVPREEL